MLAGIVVLGDEDPEEFRLLVDAYIGRFKPADDIDLAFVEQMAAAQWRQTRSWAIEANLVNTAAASAKTDEAVDRITQAFATLAAGPELALLHRYETRQSRLFQRALHNLLLLRKETMPNEPSPISEHGPELIPELVEDPAPEPLPEPQPVAAVEGGESPTPEAPEPDAVKPLAIGPGNSCLQAIFRDVSLERISGDRGA